MIPGEIISQDKYIELNAGRQTISLAVSNSGDRPIQVGSHFHFFETNKFLTFDRKAAFGMRLNIPSGTSVRFEPGETKTVQLVEVGGAKRMFGLNNLTCGEVNEATLDKALAAAQNKGFTMTGGRDDEL